MHLYLLEYHLGTVYYYKWTNVCLAEIPYVHIYMGRYLCGCMHIGRRDGDFNSMLWGGYFFLLICPVWQGSFHSILHLLKKTLLNSAAEGFLCHILTVLSWNCSEYFVFENTALTNGINCKGNSLWHALFLPKSHWRMSLKPEYDIKVSEFTGNCFAGRIKKN